MRAIIRGGTPHGTLRAIASKSAVHRLLICAALADSESDILCETVNRDILATVGCLNSIGAKISYSDNTFRVSPVGHGKESGVLDCGESGSTLRFLLPTCAALGGGRHFLMSGRLPERPLSPLREEMERHGIHFEYAAPDDLFCFGKMAAGEYSIRGDVSSQFVSGLLFALSAMDGVSTLEVTGKTESAPYIEMTLDALRRFGGDIRQNGNTYTVRGKTLSGRPGLCAEGDWSNAAFPLCAAALAGSSVTLTGLDPNSRQGDRKILALLSEFGAKVSENRAESSVSVTGGPLHGIGIDATDIPDLVPVLAAVAAGAEGVTEITGAARLKIKESDRLASTTDMLSRLGADIRQTGDGLVIKGKKRLSGGAVSSENDHRIAMSAAVAAVLCEKDVSISDSEAVQKSYPGFYDDFASLGIEMDIYDT